MARMDGKVALVVGGAKGIGLAIAERLAREGASVTFTGRNREEVEAAASQIGANACGIVADASATDGVTESVAAVIETHGRIDALVFNAGVSRPATIDEETAEHIEAHFSVNVRGPVLGLRAAVGAMKEGASVVLIGSIAGSSAVPGRGTYAATKAALRAYARTWTAELAPRAIRVNVVSPGPTDTAMMVAAPAEIRDALIGRIPLGRMAYPEEVAAAAVFLLSDDASFIAGSELCVDGGMRQV